MGPNFRQCVQHVGDGYRQQNGHLNLPSAFYVENICSLSLIDRHNGFFALLGTIAVACFTLTLWQSTDRLWQSAENTARQQLRAYVRVELQGNYSCATIHEEFIKTNFFIANSGQTPAHNVVVESTIVISEFPLTGPLPNLESTAEKGGSKASLHPNQAPIPVVTQTKDKITPAELVMLNYKRDDGEPNPKRLYLYGEVTYKDIFGNNWVTPFRCMTEGYGATNARFVWCYDGNEAT